MAPGPDLELTTLGASREADSRTRFYGTGLSFSPARLTMNPPECTMKGFMVPTMNPVSWCFAAGARAESQKRS